MKNRHGIRAVRSRRTYYIGAGNTFSIILLQQCATTRAYTIIHIEPTISNYCYLQYIFIYLYLLNTSITRSLSILYQVQQNENEEKPIPKKYTLNHFYTYNLACRYTRRGKCKMFTVKLFEKKNYVRGGANQTSRY